MEIRHGYRQIDFDTWKRRETFELFGTGEYPHVGLTTIVDVTQLRQACAETRSSFFNAFTYVVMASANRVENFRYRIFEDQIIVCDTVDPLFNIMDNNTGAFSFGIALMRSDFGQFNQEMEQAKTRALELPPEPHNRLDTMSISCLPWFGASDMIQPLGLSVNGSIPRCVWGKMEGNGLRSAVPFSLTAHHGLLDGTHISRLLTTMATMMDNPCFLEKR